MFNRLIEVRTEPNVTVLTDVLKVADFAFA